jgi:predicted RNA binding protein YcfA (HicA-like mRNA interferase family)
MSALDPKKTYKNLKKKGFVDSDSKSVDHKYLELFHNDKLVLYTKISHGNKDIGNHLIKQMSVQCHLDKSEFMDLSNCPLSKQDFLAILEKKGLLD